MIGMYKLEKEVVSGTGKFDKSGVSSSREARDSLDMAFRYLASNSKSISNSISTRTKDYVMHISDLQGIGLNGRAGCRGVDWDFFGSAGQASARKHGCHWEHDSRR